MDTHTIVYNDGKMIVTHPTGIVNKYTEKDILIQRHAVELELLATKEELFYLDDVLKQINKSRPKPPLLTRLRNLVTRKE